MPVLESSCCGCSACAQICPKKCIAMHEDTEGFLYPHIEVSLCTDCGACEKVCPVLNAAPEQDDSPQAYVAYNKNEEERLSSSSGGIFTLLAKSVLAEGGVVFGAAMTEDCRGVHHIVVECAEDLYKLCGSKYLQSNIENTYRETEKYLRTGRKVLFSGTPCEIEGLKCFLRKKYDTLLCVDVICHGVPSPKLWRKYVLYRESCAGAPAQRTFFRHKKYGWKTFAVFFEFSNNTAYVQTASKDLFMQMFLQNLCLRPSCYHCTFKKRSRPSDITLADFWGCDDICPEIDDNKGLSAILIHSKKGQAALSLINDYCLIKSVDISDIVYRNPALTTPCRKPDSRDSFMSEIDTLAIPELAKKYLKSPSVATQIRALIPPSIKRCLKKMLRRLK